jgi:hypothetical protein
MILFQVNAKGIALCPFAGDTPEAVDGDFTLIAKHSQLVVL